MAKPPPPPAPSPRKRLVYIAGPYGAPDETTRLLNVHHACRLALFACDVGFAPIVVHPAIEAGAYGSDDDPATRERGLQVDAEICRAVALAGGACWTIENIDGTLSSGTKRDEGAFNDAFPLGLQRSAIRGRDPFRHDIVSMPWPYWFDLMMQFRAKEPR